MTQPVKLFYCYARDNEDALLNLQKVLKPLERLKLIQPWHSRQIMPGATVVEEIETHLDEAQIVILLLSSDFLESDYCYGIEMARALQLHQEAKVRVIPVLLHPCLWDITSLKELQALPANGKPISEWPNQDAAWHSVAVSIHKLVTQMQTPMVQETEQNTNTSKTRGKSRAPARTKRKQTSETAAKTKGTRTRRTTRVIDKPRLGLPKHEQAPAAEPSSTTSESGTTKPRYKRRYGRLQKNMMQIRLKILIWEPGLLIESTVVDERRNIYHSLEAEQHLCQFGSDLEVPSGFSLQDREVEQAFDSDLTVLLVEPPALGEMNEFCKHEDLLGSMLIFYPEAMKSAPGAWGLDRKLSIGYRNLEYYQEEDSSLSSVRAVVLDWVKARRSYRYSNSVRQRSGR